MPGRTSNKGFKALLVNHAEKGVFGLAALMGLATLGMTRWSHFDGTPDRITDKVKKNKAELEARTWPEEERQQFVLTQDQLPAQVVYDSLRREFRPEGFPFPMEFSTRFVHALYQRKEPLKEPVLVRLEQPLAATGRVLVQKAAPLMASAEGTTPEAEKPEKKPKEDDVPDEFRQRNAGGVGPGGAPGAPGGPAGAFGPMFTAPDLYSGTPSYPGGAYPMGEGAGGMAMPTVEGEGHHYIAVRAVFPVKDQIRKFAEAIQRPFVEAARAFDIIDFQLERQELSTSGDGKWSDWTTVDRAAAEQVLTSSDGFDPEVIAGTVTNSVMTMPLPKRVFGQWFTDVTHPALEKFQLSDKEIGEQLEYNRKLLEKYLEDQKSVQQQPKIERKGFSGLVFDNREVQASVLGGGSAYDTSYMGGGMAPEMSYGGGYGAAGGYSGGGYGGGGYSPPGYGSGGMGGSGYPMASNPARMSPGGRGAQMSPEEMMKKLSSGDQKVVDKTLMEFIKTRATVDGELLLFRYIDFAVEPGKTYRYRVRLELINPNFGRQPSEANGEATVVQGETRTSKWSEVTEATYVKPDVDYFVASVDTRKSMPQARMNMFQWDSKMGTVVQGAVDAYVGQAIGGKQKTEVINPPKHTFENEEYAFASKDFLVDATGDSKLDSKYHSDLKFTTSSGELGLPARALVADAVGNLHDLDSLSAASDEKRQRTYMERQAKAFDYLKQLAAAATSVGGLGEMASPEGMYDMYGMGGKNKKNNMRKGMGMGSGYSGSPAGGAYPGGYPGGMPPGGGSGSGSGRRPGR